MAKNLGTFSTPSTSNAIVVNNQRTHRFNVISTNVVDSITVRLEFTEDKINWHNVTNYDYIITSDTTTNLITTDVLPVSFLRFVYVSGTSDLKVIYTNY